MLSTAKSANVGFRPVVQLRYLPHAQTLLRTSRRKFLLQIRKEINVGVR